MDRSKNGSILAILFEGGTNASKYYLSQFNADECCPAIAFRPDYCLEALCFHGSAISSAGGNF